MEAVAHNPSFAKKAGVPQSVGKEFSNADKGKTFKRGDDMASKMNPGFMAMIAKKKEAAKPMKKGGMATSSMGKVKTAAPSRDGVASKGKTKGTMIKMKSGGKTC
jgi:hypothetical protein